MDRKIPTNVKNKSLVLKRRQQIFEAVVKLFSKKGYHKTTLREISKESGITLGNLYDYIITKEDTLHFLQEKATQAVMQAISNGEKGDSDPPEMLKRLIISELDAMNKYEDLILIIYQESHSMSRELLHSLLQSERNHLRQFENIIRDGVKKGYFQPTNVRMTANLIKMLIDTWIVKRWDLRGKVTFEEMKKGILEMVFRGILKDPGNAVASERKCVKSSADKKTEGGD
jgi:AcrR family transcriptional regulator